MEYKKNRQSVIADSIKNFKELEWKTLNLPVIISECKPAEMLFDLNKKAKEQCKKINERFLKFLDNPARNDEVYQKLQKIFKYRSIYNLSRESEQKEDIVNLAKERFFLGYPPRKKGDTSIGDSINWEWIIKCAIDTSKDIVIVSRDNDYGISYNNKMILNDWLRQEFKCRVSQKRQIYITSSLAEAFKIIKIDVTKEMIKEENEVIEENIIIKSKDEEIIE